ASPVAATPTARGRRTGMARSRRAPASARPKPTRSRYPRTPSGSPTAAALITSGWRRIASAVEDSDAFLRPVVVDIDSAGRPFLAGPAFDALDPAAGLRLDPHAIAGVGSSGRSGRRRRAVLAWFHL